jgi:hypothetical protein
MKQTIECYEIKNYMFVMKHFIIWIKEFYFFNSSLNTHIFDIILS